MKQTTLRVLNFALIFALALLTTYFTLGNTASTTINIFPGLSASLPIASLVIISAGLGACGAWIFTSWSDRLRKNEVTELEETKNRMKELEVEVSRLKSRNNKVFPVANPSKDETRSALKEEVS